jgi:hypothetical protein
MLVATVSLALTFCKLVMVLVTISSSVLAVNRLGFDLEWQCSLFGTLQQLHFGPQSKLLKELVDMVPGLVSILGKSKHQVN